MGVTIVLGAQWGDEGKGKIVDVLGDGMDAVVRFGGGPNAGHSLVVNGKKTVIHNCPSGIVREGMMNVVGPGVVFDPVIGVQEIALARECKSDLILDSSSPVILPIHRALDFGRELAAGKQAIGTTHKGIGPCYSDFWLRRGLTLGDLFLEDKIRSALTRGGYWDELVALGRHLKLHRTDLSKLGLSIDPLSLEETVRWCLSFADAICPIVYDTRTSINSLYESGREILFEGAQGVLLDTFHGARPYVTSSLCTAAGVSATFGIYKFDRVIGVTKAYATRVGAGQFPTELFDETDQYLREKGNEFGSTTGRPRRCGWLDLPALRYACRMGGITELVMTKLDVLSGIPELKVCECYGLFEEFGPATFTTEVLESVCSHLVEYEPWTQDFFSAQSLEDLPEDARRYLARISHLRDIPPITGVSVGPDREQMFWNSEH